MKITLYTPDGTTETFTDCNLTDVGPDWVLAFTGTNWQGVRVGRVTTLRFTIDPGTAEEILATSPLTQ